MSFVDKLKNYSTRMDKIEKENKKLAKKVENLEKTVDGYNALFNNIYIYYDLTPNKLLANAHEVILQMLDFIDNVCKKHDLEWSLYAGSLLGAVRHGGFIPWDDDCDIVMMRADYNKFLSVINDEIEGHDLKNKFKVKTNQPVGKSYAPFSKLDFWDNGNLMGFIDIFPLDYITDTENIEERYSKDYKRFRHDIENGMSLEESLEIAFENLSVSMEKTDHILSGVEIGMGYRPTPYILYETDQVFPLSTIQFEDRVYPCLNDPIYLLESKYGEYMKVPKSIKMHSFHYRLLTTENIDELLDKNIEMLNEINKNF